MRRLLLIIVALLISATAWGQSFNYHFTRNTTTEGTIIHYIVHNYPGTVTVNVTALSEYDRTPTYRLVVVTKKRDAVYLEQSELPFPFTGSAFPANLFPKVDTAAVYRLPFGGAKKVDISTKIITDNKIRSSSVEYIFRWEATPRDTVFAMRDGVIVDVGQLDYILGNEEYGIRIEHSDGTVGIYGVTNTSCSILVKRGRKVNANQSLIIIRGNSIVKWAISYYLAVRADTPIQTAIQYCTLNPFFATVDGTTQLISGEIYNSVNIQSARR